MTCSTRFRRLLQTSCLGLIGTLAVVGCGGSDTTKRDTSVGPPPSDGGLVGSVKVDQVALIFGDVDIGTPSVPKTVTVTVANAPVALNATVTGDGFAISENLCKPLQPIGTCTISVVFAPTRVGAAAGSLTIGGAAAGAAVSLSGTGRQPGVFVAQPEAFPLGTVLVGAATPITFDIVPTGTVASVSCLPSGADLTFATTTCPAAGVAVSAKCSYTFTFKAASAGEKAEAIVCTGGGTTRSVSVTAKVVTPSLLSISPATQAFSAKVGQSVTWTFNVSNTGGASTGNLSAAVAGAGFAISGNECPPQLAGFGVCKIQVTFTPATAGAVTGSLTVTDATPGSTPGTAALSGTGIDSKVTITPTTKDFGTVEIGKTASAVFTMANGGTAPTGIIALASTDAQFALASDLCSGKALDVKGQCTFAVTFMPTKVALQQAMLNASQTSDGAVLASVALSGTGQPAPTAAKLSVNPPTLDFGTTGVGVPVGPKVFTITNTGGTATGALTTLKNDSTSSVGGASQFNITGNTCSAALAPGASCQVAVTFAPTITRSASAVIVVSDGVVSSSDGTVGTTAPGTVVGIALAIPPLSVECPAFDVDGTVVGTTESVVCTVRNNQQTAGETPQESGIITITPTSTTPASGTFTLGTNNCTASLQPNTSCTFSLVFTPILKGKTTGSVSISSTNKGANNTPVEALGLLPVEIVERIADAIATGNPAGVVTDYDFGQVSMGASSNTTLTIDVYVRRNLGNINVTATDMQWPEDAATAPADFVANGGCAKVSATAPAPKKTTPYCTMTVTFSPKKKQALTNVVTAASADGSASDTGSMKGTGTGPITLSPAKMTFAGVAVGSSSVTPMTLTVCNNAPNPATSAKLTITGANASDFAIVEDTVSNQTLSPNGSADIAANCKFVRLRLDIPAGAATGPRTATVTVTGTIAGTLESGSAELFGSAIVGAGLDAVLDGTFADTPVTRTSAPVTVTVTNTGSAQTDVIEFEIPNAAGSSFNDFTLTPPDGQAQGTCTIDKTVRLDPSTSCQVKVWFKPTTGLGVDVQRRATLIVFSKVGGRKVLDLVARATPQLTITPASQVFDPTRLAADNPLALPVKTFTITNNGADPAPLTVSFRNDTNETAAAQYYRVSRPGNPASNGECPATLPAWGSATGANTCMVDVQLRPVGLPGPRDATLDAQTAGTQRASAKISGSAVKKPQLLFTGDESVSISASTVDHDFGAVMLGYKSAPRSFTLTNVGGEQAGRITVKLMNLSTAAGAGEVLNAEHAKTADFAVTGSCLSGDTSVLGAGQSCSFQVVYQPTACATITTACPYTTNTTDVVVAVFTQGNNGTADTGLRGAKLYGQGVDPTSARFVLGPNDLGGYDFGLVSATTAKTAIFTLVNKAATAFTAPDTFTAPDSTLVTVVTTDPVAANPETARSGDGEFTVEDGPTSNPNSCALGETSIPAGGYCLFTIKWTPSAATAVGTREVALTLTGVTPFNVFGRVALPASLLVVPAALGQSGSAVDFGMSVIGVDSAETRTLTIRNVGEVATGAIKVVKTTSDDVNAGQVVVGDTTCQGASSDVAPGATCTIQVRVHPTGDPADRTGSGEVQALDIVPFTGSTTSWMRVSDIFVSWQAINPPTLEPSPTASLDFDTAGATFPGTSVLSTGTTRVITLTNPGNSAPTGSLSFRTDKDDFAIDLASTAGHSTCLAPALAFSGLEPGIDLTGTGTVATCTVAVVFSPTALANPAKTGNLIINSASGATLTVALKGTAIPALKVTGANPSTLYTETTATAIASKTYPDTSITAYTDVVFAFAKADGSPPTGLLSTSIGGGADATPDQFKIVADTCIGVSLKAGASTCSVTVRFAPTTSGTNKNAVLTVADPTSGTPIDSVSVALKGNANQ